MLSNITPKFFTLSEITMVVLPSKILEISTLLDFDSVTMEHSKTSTLSLFSFSLFSCITSVVNKTFSDWKDSATGQRSNQATPMLYSTV